MPKQLTKTVEAVPVEAITILDPAVAENKHAGPTVAFGNVILPIKQYDKPEEAKFVPQGSQIVNANHELETLALSAAQNLPTLLIGETGTGKTSLVRHLAFKTQNAFRRLNLNGGTTNDEIKGHYVADSQGMRWVDGVLTEAMKFGYWLVLDEINACLPEVTFTLHSVLDDDHMLVLEEHEGEIITPHPNFRVFATMNPSMEYSGTKDLNKALLSRFPIVLQTVYADPIHEMQIVRSHVPDIKDADLTLMVRVAEGVRQGKENNSIGFICSTRELINWALLLRSMPMKPAAELAVLNKCESSSDRRTVEDIFKMHFGKWESNKLPSLVDLERQVAEVDKKVAQANSERDDALNGQEVLRNQTRRLQDELDKLSKFKELAEMMKQSANEDSSPIF